MRMIFVLGAVLLVGLFLTGLVASGLEQAKPGAAFEAIERL